MSPLAYAPSKYILSFWIYIVIKLFYAQNGHIKLMLHFNRGYSMNSLPESDRRNYFLYRKFYSRI